MRGSTLFADIAYSEPALAEKQSKGRSSDLIAKRNELLVDRFFYYKSRRYDYVYILELLSNEFFLAESTIPQILEKPNNQVYYRRLRMEQPEIKTFKIKWPHLLWAA